jgi:DNA-binding IclR family transcriptional regulator
MRSVDRFAGILNAIGGSRVGLTCSSVSTQIGLPRPTVHRILHSLASQGFVRKDEAVQTYYLGPILLRLGDACRAQWDLRRASLPHIRRLALAANESILLAAWYGDTVICLDSVESERSYAYFVTPGRELPINAAAGAKAMLAYQPAEDIDKAIACSTLTSFTTSTITDPDELKAELAEVRRKGFSECDGELEVGVNSIASPILKSDGRAVGSVVVLGPTQRFDAEARERVLPELLTCTRMISGSLGAEMGFRTR